MKYSVIIPVYNAAATIGRCLDSLLAQPHENVRILLIDDGSTDESGEICRRYARSYPCVAYYEKENGGVSSARNLGMEKADGEYILFVDSDDYVTPDYFAVIDRAMTRWDPDMLMFGLRCFGAYTSRWQTGNFCTQDPREIGKHVRSIAHAYLYSNLMTRSFRRSIIQERNLRFDEDLLIGEDQAFIFSYTMYVRRMASVDCVIYNYSTENTGSLSRRPRPYLTEQLLQVSNLMRRALEQSDCPEPVRKIYRETVAWAHYRSVYSACKELRKFDHTPAQRRKQIRRICEVYKKAGIRPAGFKTRLIALPVLGKMTLVLDGLSGYRERRRKRGQ